MTFNNTPYAATEKGIKYSVIKWIGTMLRSRIIPAKIGGFTQKFIRGKFEEVMSVLKVNPIIKRF